MNFFCFFAILWLLVLLGSPLLFDLGTLEIGQLSENGVFWYSPQMAISECRFSSGLIGRQNPSRDSIEAWSRCGSPPLQRVKLAEAAPMLTVPLLGDLLEVHKKGHWKHSELHRPYKLDASICLAQFQEQRVFQIADGLNQTKGGWQDRGNIRCMRSFRWRIEYGNHFPSQERKHRIAAMDFLYPLWGSRRLSY